MDGLDRINKIFVRILALSVVKYYCVAYKMVNCYVTLTD